MQATSQGTQGTPARITDGAGLRSAMLRRDELENQLESLSDATGQLTRERMDATMTKSGEQVQVLTERISEMAQRTRRLEGEKFRLDDAISDALARGVSATPGVTTVEIPEINIPPIMLPPFSEMPIPGRPFVADRDELYSAIAGGLLGVVLLAVAMWRLGKRSAAKTLKRAPAEPEGVKELRHAVEAIAVEVERISEGQRFVTALLSDKGQKAPAAIQSNEAGRQG